VLLEARMNQLLFTQVYCLGDNRALLMKRNKEPNLGLWVAPGGKIEPDETPYECALRELLEETGLQAQVMYLRGIVSAVMPTLTAPCIQFLYVVTQFAGVLTADEREGSLRWWPIGEVQHIPTAQEIPLYLPHILDANKPFYQGKLTFDAGWRLIDVVEHSAHVGGDASR
jgi:8-oxo-dGTP diphosphatase